MVRTNTGAAPSPHRPIQESPHISTDSALTVPPARLPQRATWLAGAALIACAVALLLMYPLLLYGRGLFDVGRISGNPPLGLTTWMVVLAGSVTAWLYGSNRLRGIAVQDAWRPLAAITLPLYLASALTYPGTAIDVYIYAVRSHLLTGYGVDPSTFTPIRYWETDGFVQFASREWADDVSPYGPLWNIIAAPATALDGDDIIVAVLLFKLIAILAIVGCAALIHAIVRDSRPDLAVAATAAWLWCPLITWEGIANAHNDVVLMLPVLAAVRAWQVRAWHWVLPLLVASALIKVVTVILLPAAALAIARQVGWNRHLLSITGMSAAISLGVAWVAFAPFYDVRGVVEAVLNQGSVWVTSPPLLMNRIGERLNWPFDFGAIYLPVSQGVIVLIAAIGGFVAWRRPDQLPRIAFEMLFWLLLLCTTNLRPWYGIWLVALAVILPASWAWWRAAAWVAGGLASYAISAWVRGPLGWDLLTFDAVNLAAALGPVLVVTIRWGIVAWRKRRHRRRNAATALARDAVT